MTFKLLLPVVALAFALPMLADDKPKTKPAAGEKAKKEVKLEGELVCTKCKLNETEACGHALIVTEKVKGKKDKEVKYYINDSGATEKYHKAICTKPKPAVVKGKVGEEKDEDGKKKMVINDAKVEVKE